MIISNISSKKLIRYPTLFSSLSFLSPPSPYSLSSITETLNPSFSPYSHQTSTSRYFYTSSTGLPSDFSVPPPFPHSSNSDVFRFNTSYIDSICFIGLISPSFCRFLSSVPPKTDKNSEFEDMRINRFNEPAVKEKNTKQATEIIELIRSGEDDLASKLNSIALNLSVQSINEIFWVLNCEKISAFNFFQWLLHKNPNLYSNYDVCSLIIDNCGRLNDYKTMVYILNVFKKKRICLTESAFGFLPVLDSNKALVEESIKRVVGVLMEVGGSCNGSGICALINMLCKLDFFEMAKFIIDITERKDSYYNILIRQRCKRSQIEEAKALIREMRELGCNLDTKSFNYLLGCLCKNDKLSEGFTFINEMQEMGFSPDASTFEVFMFYLFKQGKMDVANEFLDGMASMDLEPRYTTHVIFLKGYFQLGKYEKALKYVESLGEKGDKSINMMYSLLADLHQKKGDLIVAESILNEMMDKGLKPNFSVYFRIMKQLDLTGRGDLALQLKSNFAKFRVEYEN